MYKLTFLLLLSVLLSCSSQRKPMNEISQEEKQELIQYLKTNWKTPEDYVVGKFADYDIVFIGEFHRIKHDVELIHNLIPRLYKIGVYSLGIEFGCYEYQDKVDSLITQNDYDEDLARWLMFKDFVAWGYKEYIDIYKKAWELNHTLPKGSPRFRVVNLNYRANWHLAKEEMTPELWKQVWHKGDYDEYMAQVILKEFVDRGQKVLIYCGSHHAFTRYHQPVYDYEKKQFVRFNTTRTGNILYNKIPERVFNIFLHSPWSIKSNYEEYNYPISGAIDRVMKEFKDKRVGFDVKNSPFAKLTDKDTYYSIGYDNFTLEAFCDGYIFQKHFKDYQGCTVDTAFITIDNFQEAVENFPNVEVRKFFKTPVDMINGARNDADIKRRFRYLE